MKKFLLGFLVGSLIFGTTTALASEEVKAYFTNYKLSVNGRNVNLNNKIVTINGSSYLPLKDVSNVLGYKVEWDGYSKTVGLSNNGIQYFSGYPSYEFKRMPLSLFSQGILVTVHSIVNKGNESYWDITIVNNSGKILKIDDFTALTNFGVRDKKPLMTGQLVSLIIGNDVSYDLKNRDFDKSISDDEIRRGIVKMGRIPLDTENIRLLISSQGTAIFQLNLDVKDAILEKPLDNN